MPLVKAYLLPNIEESNPASPTTLTCLKGALEEIAAIKPDIIIFLATVASMNSEQILVETDEKQITAKEFIVPKQWVDRYYQDYQAIYICSGLADAVTHYRFGEDLATEYEGLQQKVVMIGCGDLAHGLTGENQVGKRSQGQMYDNTIVTTMTYNDYKILLMTSESLRKQAKEKGFNTIVMLAGYMNNRDVVSHILSYQNDTGTGHLIASITPGNYNSQRNLLGQTAAIYEENTRRIKAGGGHHHHD